MEKIMEKDLLIEKPLEEVVDHYAANAKKAGLDGVVCSPLEAGKVHEVCGDKEYHDKVHPAGGRIFCQPLCGLHPRLQILLCLFYETVHRAYRIVGNISGYKTLAGN